MGTRSIVGVPTSDGQGFRGRYVHWDGYPAGVGQALAAIVTRDGYGMAIETMTVKHTEWSKLTGQSKNSAMGEVDVPGYGVAYETSRDVWLTETGDDWGAQWAYAILERIILVWHKPIGGTWRRMPDNDITIGA